MNWTRKYVYTDYLISSIPVEDYHNSVRSAIGGGYVTRDGNSLYFYGSSVSLGIPNTKKLEEIIKAGGLGIGLSNLADKIYIFSAYHTLKDVIDELEFVGPRFIKIEENWLEKKETTRVLRTVGEVVNNKFIPNSEGDVIRFYLPYHFSTFFLYGEGDKTFYHESTGEGKCLQISFNALKDKSFKEIEKTFYPESIFNEEVEEVSVQE